MYKYQKETLEHLEESKKILLNENPNLKIKTVR